MLIRSNQIIVLFRSSISLLICLLDLSISDRGVLKSSIIKGNSSISPFNSISFCLMYFDMFDSLKKIFQYYFLWFIDPCQKLQFGIYILKHGKAQLLCFGNTGLLWVCFCYLLCWAMLSHFMCLTLCNPMDCSVPGSSVLGIFQNAGVGYHALFQGIFPTQEWTQLSCIAGGFFTTETPGKPYLSCRVWHLKSYL